MMAFYPTRQLKQMRYYKVAFKKASDVVKEKKIRPPFLHENIIFSQVKTMMPKLWLLFDRVL